MVTELNPIKRKPGRPRTWTEERVDELAQDLLAYLDELPDDEYFPVMGWSVKRRFHREQLKRFQSISQAFRDAIKIARCLEEHRLANKLVRDKVATVGTIFALKNVSGWVDKREVETTSHQTITVEKKELKEQATEQLLENIRQLTSSNTAKN